LHCRVHATKSNVFLEELLKLFLGEEDILHRSLKAAADKLQLKGSGKRKDATFGGRDVL